MADMTQTETTQTPSVIAAQQRLTDAHAAVDTFIAKAANGGVKPRDLSDARAGVELAELELEGARKAAAAGAIDDVRAERQRQADDFRARCDELVPSMAAASQAARAALAKLVPLCREHADHANRRDQLEWALNESTSKPSSAPYRGPHDTAADALSSVLAPVLIEAAGSALRPALMSRINGRFAEAIQRWDALVDADPKA